MNLMRQIEETFPYEFATEVNPWKAHLWLKEHIGLRWALIETLDEYKIGAEFGWFCALYPDEKYDYKYRFRSEEDRTLFMLRFANGC